MQTFEDHPNNNLTHYYISYNASMAAVLVRLMHTSDVIDCMQLTGAWRKSVIRPYPAQPTSFVPTSHLRT
jgi:hypothetical protein